MSMASCGGVELKDRIDTQPWCARARARARMRMRMRMRGRGGGGGGLPFTFFVFNQVRWSVLASRLEFRFSGSGPNPIKLLDTRLGDFIRKK